MSHDTHAEHGHDHHEDNKLDKSKTALSSSFWLVVVIAGLFICSLNFMSAMSHSDSEGHAAAGHDTHAAPHGEAGAAHGSAEPHGVTEPEAATHGAATSHDSAGGAHSDTAHPAAPAEHAEAAHH